VHRILPGAHNQGQALLIDGKMTFGL